MGYCDQKHSLHKAILLSMPTVLHFQFMLHSYKHWLKHGGLNIRDQSRLVFLPVSILTFWNCQDFLGCRDLLFETVEIESLNWDQVETNWDPQVYINLLTMKFPGYSLSRICFDILIKIFQIFWRPSRISWTLVSGLKSKSKKII
jgi:hypothetical protein